MRAYKYVSAYWYPDEGAEINQPPLPLKKSMAVALILASRITGGNIFQLQSNHHWALLEVNEYTRLLVSR
ncbi:hypothetical protein CSB62_12625 [Vibrio splendidus]|uniref:Uncharacterized protein n=1 Tax=Vibrio lentus TaxID=136468 RepID=A0A855IM33_9VIBR|nr:hypothetical protein CSB62_12625 [Vibrio splendidus]PME96836.1 hypothetical protein BCV23_15465 [Vibrio lentus]PMF86538.1 hypothetical protein BCV10_07665 [Vibrio lentus]PMG59744.1 hypothetical protein BCU87_17860 [Vibrio lentus]PMG95621.1 hypothetical protein BCU78_08620 [Vibrio lentus]